MHNFKFSGFSDEISEKIDIQFEVLNKLGIEYFEPRGVDGVNISALSDEDRANLKEKMARYNIKVSSIGSPIGKIKLSDDFEAHFEMFTRVVDTAIFLDAKYIRMFSFYHDGGDEWTDSERSEVFENLTKMIDYAKEHNIVLLHENEKDVYGDTWVRCLDLMENLSCENFRAVFDPANFVQCGQDTKKAYDALAPYIEYMHIKDADSSGRVVPAGHGAGNVDYILSDLYKNGYDGFLSLEPHLGSFVGLADLELDDAMLSLPQSGENTFTVAFNALKKITETL